MRFISIISICLRVRSKKIIPVYKKTFPINNLLFSVTSSSQHHYDRQTCYHCQRTIVTSVMMLAVGTKIDLCIEFLHIYTNRSLLENAKKEHIIAAYSCDNDN